MPDPWQRVATELYLGDRSFSSQKRQAFGLTFGRVGISAELQIVCFCVVLADVQHLLQ